MIERVIVRHRAKRDIREARLWYREISHDLGEAFLKSVGDAIALAQRHPLAFHLVHRTFRRVLSSVFLTLSFIKSATIASLSWQFCIRLGIQKHY